MSNEKLIAEARQPWRTAYGDGTCKPPIIERMADALAQADKEIESLRKDALRYRWLRDKNWFAYKIVSIADYGRSAHETNEFLDDAIDAAMPEGE